MMFGGLGTVSRAGGRAASARTATVDAASTGAVYTIARMLGSASSLSLIAGTNSNLTLTASTGVISAAAAIGAGGSQVAVIRESAGQLAVEYPVTIIGSAGSPTPTPTPTPSPGVAWSFPVVFTGGALPVSLAQTQASQTYSSTYNQAAFEHTGTTYYVSSTGSDGNDGLSAGAAKRTIQSAIDAAATGSRIMVGAGRFAPYTIASKNLSVIGVEGQTFIGDLLTNADVSSWGTPASGRQAVTLISGVVSGFVDLTKTRRADRQGRPIPQVSQVAATAAGIATLQARTTGQIELALYGTTTGSPDPQAGVFRSTPSQLGASDGQQGRDLSRTFDTELLAWRSTAAAPYTVSGTTQAFFKGLTFVGGAQCVVVTGTRVVEDNCRNLGGVDQCIFTNGGQTVLYRTVLRACAVGGMDVHDMDGNCTAMEVESWIDQCSNTGADNCSTQHKGVTLRINSTYLDGSRCVNDGYNVYIGVFGCTLGTGSGQKCLGNGGNGDSAEGHYAGLTFIPGAQTDFFTGLASSRSYVYDNSLVGKTLDVFNNALYDRSGTRTSTGDDTFIAFSVQDLNTLFKDTAGTQPAAVGDTVVRINSLAGPTEYATATAGTCTLQTDGTRYWLQSAGNNLAWAITMAADKQMDERSNIVIGLKSSDTAGILVSHPSPARFLGDYRNTNPLTEAASTYVGFGAYPSGYHVDGSSTALSTATQMKSAAFNGSAHVVSIRNANLSWLGWNFGVIMMAQFDGSFYGLEISRAKTPAALRAREATMAARAGATLVN